MARSERERLIDRLLTTYIINQCEIEHDVHLSETKLQKLVFLSEKKLIEDKIKALNYQYMKFLHGPYSNELRSDLSVFSDISYLKGPFINGTPRLRWIIEDFRETFDRNPVIINYIEDVLEEYAGIPTNRLLEIVYAMPWNQGRMIEDLPNKTPMLYPLKSSKATRVFEIENEDLRDLKFCFSERSLDILGEANDDLRKGRLLTHEQFIS